MREIKENGKKKKERENNVKIMYVIKIVLIKLEDEKINENLSKRIKLHFQKKSIKKHRHIK